MPAVHALTGCDIVFYLFGIGKVTSMKALMGHIIWTYSVSWEQMKTIWYLRQLPSLLPVMVPKLKEVWTLTVISYGSPKWPNKISLASALKLKSLPPTHDAFVQHVHRAQLQVIIWKSVARWCSVVSNHTSTWCVSCTRHHSETDQVWMFHQSSMFHWDVWLCCSSNVMLDVLLLQCWVRLL